MVSGKPSFFFTVPAKNPRTLCCCQSVARIISAMLAPSGRLRRVSKRSCLVTRSSCGSSPFTGVLAAACPDFDKKDRGGFLALAAGDVTLRRDAVFDWALPFLGAALFVFRDFMERVDIVWAPLVRGAGLDARTTPSPAHRGAKPFNGRLWLGQPMTTPMRTMRRKSSRFCALKSARTSSVTLVGITTGAPSPDSEFLSPNTPLRARRNFARVFRRLQAGSLDCRQIAALAGLALWTRQSGQWRGKSFVGGGRKSVRSTLFVGAKELIIGEMAASPGSKSHKPVQRAIADA